MLHQFQLLALMPEVCQALLDAAADLLIVIHRFDEEVPGPRPQRTLDRSHLILTGDDDDGHLWIAGGEAGNHLMAIHVRHVQITQHHIGVIERCGREPLNPVFCLKDAGPVVLEIRYQ